MKNSLMVPLVFLVNLVIWVCSISVISVLGSWRYLDALTGGNIRLFLLMCGYQGLYFLPIGIFLGLISVFFFLMRHDALPFISIPLVLALAATSVMFALPYSYTLMGRIESRFPAAMETQDEPSSRMFETGFIRGISDIPERMWMDFSNADEPRRNILVADTRNSGAVFSFYMDAVYDRAAGSIGTDSGVIVSQAGGVDPLYGHYLDAPRFILPLASDAKILLDALRTSRRASLVDFIWFAGSFFLAVTVLWFFCYLTGWRMLNVLFVCVSLRILLFLYPFTASGLVPQTIARFLPDPALAERVSPLLYLSFSALVILVSVGEFIRRKVKRSRTGAFHE